MTAHFTTEKETNMFRGMAVIARIQNEANLEWKERFDRMTLDEKRAELSKTTNLHFYASGLNAVMLVGLLPMFAFNIFTGAEYDPWMMGWAGLMVFLAGAGPIVGLHWGTHARLAKKYDVYVRTAEHTALDILFSVMVVFALEVHFNYLNSLEVNLILLAVGILVQTILFRWSFFGKGHVRPTFNSTE